MSRLSNAKKEVKRCLCDDFDTPGAVGALQELVKAVNKVCRLVAVLRALLLFVVAGGGVCVVAFMFGVCHFFAVSLAALSGSLSSAYSRIGSGGQ